VYVCVCGVCICVYMRMCVCACERALVMRTALEGVSGDQSVWWWDSLCLLPGGLGQIFEVCEGI